MRKDRVERSTRQLHLRFLIQPPALSREGKSKRGSTPDSSCPFFSKCFVNLLQVRAKVYLHRAHGTAVTCGSVVPNQREFTEASDGRFPPRSLWTTCILKSRKLEERALAPKKRLTNASSLLVMTLICLVSPPLALIFPSHPFARQARTPPHLCLHFNCMYS